MANNGTSAVLSPQDINASNYPAMTGTPLLAATASAGAGADEQSVLLTTSGLFVWGKEDVVVNTSLTSSLEKIEVGKDLGKMLDVKPIYFDLGKSDIRPDAAAELDKIVAAMNENPTIEIELGSHTDCRGSKASNAKLSDARAKASAEYVQSRITNPKRIFGKGYGESKLVNGCACEGKKPSTCTEEEHQANRRTEFKIIKI